MSPSRPPFSQRVGARKIPVLEMEDMPESLRVALWNTFASWYMAITMFGGEQDRRRVWVYGFHATNWPVDEAYSDNYVNKRLKLWFFDNSTEWHKIYDFVEAIPQMVWYGLGNPDQRQFRNDNRRGHDYAIQLIQEYTPDLNQVLEREGSPYRYQDGTLLPITNQHELEEISMAINELPFAGAREHIETAARSLSARPAPDFRNCIKESISAMESVLWETTGLPTSTKMRDLINEFAKKYEPDMHPALKGAIEKLYGWTSDDSGVRHGISGDVTVTQAEARLALVTCSALVNFMAQKKLQAGK